jgi:DNA-binding XRE family transcriptional regulator
MNRIEYRILRRLLRMTQRELAKRLGLSEQTIRDREAGRGRIPEAEAELLRRMVDDIDHES